MPVNCPLFHGTTRARDLIFHLLTSLLFLRRCSRSRGTLSLSPRSLCLLDFCGGVCGAKVSSPSRLFARHDGRSPLQSIDGSADAGIGEEGNLGLIAACRDSFFWRTQVMVVQEGVHLVRIFNVMCRAAWI